MASNTVFKDADLVATLAWLDFCRRNGLDFWETVPAHLTEARTQRGDDKYTFTKTQVKNKFRSMLRPYSKAYSSEAISSNGSTYFEDFISKTTQRAIRKELGCYEALRSQTLHQNSGQLGRTGIPRRAKTRSAGACFQNLTNVDLSGDAVTASQTMLPPTLTASERPAKPEHMSVTRPNISAEVALNISTAPTSLRPAESPLDQRFREDITRRDIEISNIREQWQQEVGEFSQQLARYAQTEIELRAQIKHLQMAQEASRLTGRATLENKLSEMYDNIWSLTRKVQEMQKLTNFTAKDPQQAISGINSEIQNTMDFVSSEMESILNGNDSTTLFGVPFIASNSDLGALVRCISNNRVPIDQETEWLKKYILKSSSSGMVARALIAAALREWVFATPFPNFLPVPCPLLRATREAVMTQNNWKGLHNLDLAAHLKLIDSSHFQENTIPHKAKELAARLSKVLAGLFARPDNESEGEIFNSWRRDNAVWEERGFRFAGIFETVLRLKASTVTTDQQYEFVVYPPGTSHMREAEKQPHSAQSDRRNISIGDSWNDNRPSWRHASIHCYPTKGILPQDPLVDALVDSNNFITRTAQERAELCTHTSYITVSKTETVNFAPQSTLETSQQQTQRGSMAELPHVQRAYGGMLPIAMPTVRNPNDECYIEVDENEHGTINTATGVKRGKMGDWRCVTCSRSFSRQANLTRHQVAKACPLCKECKVYFPSKEELSEHRKQCDNLKPSKDATSTGLLKSAKQSPPIRMTHQNATHFPRPTEKPKPKHGLTPSTTTLPYACAICDKRFSTQRDCNIHKGKMHKQRPDPKSLELSECRSAPGLKQSQVSSSDEAIHGRLDSDCTGSVSVVIPAQGASEGQINVTDEQNSHEPPPKTPGGVPDRLTTSNLPSKRPRSVSPGRETRRIKTAVRSNDGRHQEAEDGPSCQSPCVEDQLRGSGSADLEPVARSVPSTSNDAEDGESPSTQLKIL